MVRKAKQHDHPFSAFVDGVVRALDDARATENVTTLWTVSANARVHSNGTARVPGTVAGVQVRKEVFLQVDPQVSATSLRDDTAPVSAGEHVLEIEGAARWAFTGERVALGVLQGLSAIATTTARFFAEVSDLPVQILDTRTTVPALRRLDKYAVRYGGATNHRRSLGAMVLIEENHSTAASSIVPAVCAVQDRLGQRQGGPDRLTVEVEIGVTSVDEAREALACGVDWVLLDSMSMKDVTAVVQTRESEPAFRAIRLEASGNVTLASVHPIARCGVDAISVGALTHSPTAADLGLLVEQPQQRSATTFDLHGSNTLGSCRSSWGRIPAVSDLVALA